MDYADNFPRNDIFNCFGLNNSPLNGSITVDEIRKSINSLKMVSLVVQMETQMKC